MIDVRAAAIATRERSDSLQSPENALAPRGRGERVFGSSRGSARWHPVHGGSRLLVMSWLLGLWTTSCVTACANHDTSTEVDSSGGAPSFSGSGGAGGTSGGTGSAGATGGMQSASGALNGGTGGRTDPALGGQRQTGGEQSTSGGRQSTGGDPSSGGGDSTTGGQSLPWNTGGSDPTGGTGGARSGGTGGGGTGGGETGGSGGGETGGMSAGGASGAPPSTGGGSVTIPDPGPNGERYPFPQEVRYPHGVQSTAVTSQKVKSWYDSWRGRYLKECNGNLMPSTENASIAKVEAVGFAMVAAAYMGDKEAVDGIWGFYKSKTSSQGCGLMGWQVSCGGVNDSGAATDGDVDVASGLIVAHWQWPNDGYDEKAREVISNLKKMILDCGGTSALYPGCSGGRPWGGCNETDISYYSPAFFRYYAEISGDDAWTKLADDSHVIRDNGAHPSTGLVPDWQSVSGTPGSGSRAGYFGFDAIRTPYKGCLDYLWTGNSRAEAWCSKVSSWAHNTGVNRLVDGYNLDGSSRGGNHNLAVVGSLSVAAMANSQDVADAFAQESSTLRDDFWYSGYLGNLYLLALSGNMWNPEIAGY